MILDFQIVLSHQTLFGPHGKYGLSNLDGLLMSLIVLAEKSVKFGLYVTKFSEEFSSLMLYLHVFLMCATVHNSTLDSLNKPTLSANNLE